MSPRERQTLQTERPYSLDQARAGDRAAAFLMSDRSLEHLMRIAHGLGSDTPIDPVFGFLPMGNPQEWWAGATLAWEEGGAVRGVRVRAKDDGTTAVDYINQAAHRWVTLDDRDFDSAAWAAHVESVGKPEQEMTILDGMDFALKRTQEPPQPEMAIPVV